MLIYLLLLYLVVATCTAARADTLTIFYAGEEQGQLGLHGCGAEQIGGLAHRQSVIDDLRRQHDTVLNLHTGNLIDPMDPNPEWIYQIGLSALDAMRVEVMCLGPKDLSLPLETLEALHANHPEVGVVCANIAAGIDTPYLTRTISSVDVAIVGLVSDSHTQVLPDLKLIPPETALAGIKARLIGETDVIIVVLHGTQAEAQHLAETTPWIDVLIVANDEQPNTLSYKGFHSGAETVIVTNATQGAAIGTLMVKLDKHLKVQEVTNRHHAVSEKIAPDAQLTRLVEAYEILTASTREVVPPANKGAAVPAADRAPANSIHIVYFHKHGCQKCTRAVKILTALKTEYPQIVIQQRNAKTEQMLLEAMGALYEVPETKRLASPTIFIGDTALIGELNQQQLETIVQKYLDTGVASRLTEAETHLETADSEIVNRFHKFGALAVASAGLLDGINPCAFATLVFFISYMNLVGRGQREMLMAGGAFTLSVFVTYLLLGLGTLSFMTYLQRFSVISKCVYLFAAAATFALAGLSLYDAVKAKQGKTKQILLQLPRALKLKIHKVIRERTRTSGVIVGAFVIGFTISALELVCTGQVYLPTLTFVAGIGGMRSEAFTYLLVYNVMFIVPLLIVFGCVYWGTTSLQLGGVLQRHLVTVKVGIGILLFGLGTWLVISVMV